MSLTSIAIVTPSFNQAPYISQAIESVLEAKARVPINYAVIDGGSTDGTVEIIKRYEKHLSFWVSEPDRGQSDAINKGLRKLSGEAWAYLNSDDYYVAGALEEVSETFASTGAKWITGTGRYFRGDDETVRDMVPVTDWSIEDVLLGLSGAPIMVASQVSNFMSREVLERYGFFDESYHYVMDVEFGLRLLVDGIRPTVLPKILGMARLHDESKTVSEGNIAFPRELETLLANLDLTKYPNLERAQKKALSLLIKRRALRLFLGEPNVGDSVGRKALLDYLRRHPVSLLDREVLGAIRKVVLGNV